MEMLEEFILYFRKEELFYPNEKGLLAVSGGVDSMVMADLFAQAGLPFAIAHINFKLRGDESDADESFVKEAAERYGVDFYSTSFDTEKYASERGISIQMAARQLRYDWLEEIIENNNLEYIATAHHINDSLETVLLNLTKGTGISGVRGILPKIGKIVRPLSFATRTEIEKYAASTHIAFRKDSSNDEVKYERNKIRHQVLPVLRELNPKLEKTFAETLKNLQAAEVIYYEAVTRCTKKLLNTRGHDHYISIKKLKKLSRSETILYEMLKPFGFNKYQVSQLYDILDEPPGRIFESEEYKVVKDRKHIIITHMSREESNYIHIYPEAGEIPIGEKNIHCSLEKTSHYDIPKDPTVAALDFGKLEFPLILRKWRDGDYFYPLGMTKPNSDKIGKKKVSDFFTDVKMPVHDKEKVWILTSGEKIAWVAGFRIDDRFKITDKTETVFELRYNEKAPE